MSIKSLSKELAQLRVDVLMLLTCLVKQDTSPFPQVFSTYATSANTQNPDAIPGSPDLGEGARRQIDLILYNIIIWSNTELTKEHLDNISEDDANLIPSLKGLIDSLVVISHRLTHLFSKTDIEAHGLDPVLQTVSKNFEQKVKSLEQRVDGLYDDCPLCGRDGPLGRGAFLNKAPEFGYLDQINDLVLELRGDSQPVHRALRRREFRRVAKLQKEALELSENDTTQIAPYKTISSKGVSDSTAELDEGSVMHHVSPLESWNLGKEHSQSPEMQQSLSNEFDSLIKRWEKVRDAFSTLEGQWVQKKPGLEALEKLHGSRMSLLMSTDAMTFERSNISKALDRLRKALRARTALPVTPGDTDLAAKFESMNLSLTGDNLPRDIVTRLIEAVPANEAWNATITPTPGLLRSQRQLRAAHSVLQALPTWIFHSSENDRDLIEHLIHIIQANLIDRVISCISDIMKVVAPRVYGGDYNMLIYQAIIVLTRSAAHLLEIQPSKQASIPWAETTPTLRQLVMEANTFSAHLASVLGLNGELKSNPYSGVADILALPPVHFLIYVPRKNEGFAEEDELMRDDSIEDVESAGDRIMEDDDLMGDEIVTQDDDITESNSGISQLRDVINADSFIAVSAGDLLYKDSRPE